MRTMNPARSGKEKTVLVAQGLIVLGGIMIIAGFLPGLVAPAGFRVSGLGLVIIAVGFILMKKPDYLIFLPGL